MATKKSTTPVSSPAPAPASTMPSLNNVSPMQNMQNMQSVDLDKMQSLLNQSQKLMGDLKNAFPGMSNILGNLGQQ